MKIESLKQEKPNKAPLQIVPTSVCSPPTSVALRVLPTKLAFSNTCPQQLACVLILKLIHGQEKKKEVEKLLQPHFCEFSFRPVAAQSAGVMQRGKESRCGHGQGGTKILLGTAYSEISLSTL